MTTLAFNKQDIRDVKDLAKGNPAAEKAKREAMLGMIGADKTRAATSRYVSGQGAPETETGERKKKKDKKKKNKKKDKKKKTNDEGGSLASRKSGKRNKEKGGDNRKKRGRDGGDGEKAEKARQSKGDSGEQKSKRATSGNTDDKKEKARKDAMKMKKSLEDAEEEYDADEKTPGGLPKHAGKRKKDPPTGSGGPSKRNKAATAAKEKTKDTGGTSKTTQQSASAPGSASGGRHKGKYSVPDVDESAVHGVLGFGEHVYEPNGNLTVQVMVKGEETSFCDVWRFFSNEYERRAYVTKWRKHCNDIGATEKFYKGIKDKEAYLAQERNRA